MSEHEDADGMDNNTRLERIAQSLEELVAIQKKMVQILDLWCYMFGEINEFDGGELRDFGGIK